MKPLRRQLCYVPVCNYSRISLIVSDVGSLPLRWGGSSWVSRWLAISSITAPGGWPFKQIMCVCLCLCLCVYVCASVCFLFLILELLLLEDGTWYMILLSSPLSSVTCFLQLYPSTKVSTQCPSEYHPDWILSSQLLSRASLLGTFSVDAEVIFPDYLILDIY